MLLQVQKLFRQLKQNTAAMLLQSTLWNIFQTGMSLLYKIQVVLCKIAHKCHGELQQVCEDDVLPCCIMAYWVQALKNSRQHERQIVYWVPCISSRNCWQVTGICHTRNLPDIAGISAPMLLCILHDKWRMRNTAIRWVLHSLSKIQMWAWRQSMFILSST